MRVLKKGRLVGVTFPFVLSFCCHDVILILYIDRANSCSLLCLLFFVLFCFDLSARVRFFSLILLLVFVCFACRMIYTTSEIFGTYGAWYGVWYGMTDEEWWMVDGTVFV